MKRAVKIISILFVVLVGLCVAGVAVLVSLDLNDYKGTIAEKAKEATGRDLAISGNISVAWSLSPTLRVEGVTFSNADWSSRKEMLKLGVLEAQVSLLPLLSGQIRVPHVLVKGLDVIAETDAKGKGNWEMGPAAAKPAEPEEASEGGAPIIPVIEELVVENVKATYKDGVSGQTIEAVVDSLTATSESTSSPVAIALKASVNGAPIALDGTVGAPAALMANESYPVKLKAVALQVVAALDGAIKQPMDAKGIDIGLKVDIADLAATLKAASVIVPDLAKQAEGMAPTAIALAAKAKDTDGGYALNGITLTIGDSDVGGDAAIALSGARPKATATLASKLLDLNALAGLAGGGKDQGAPAAADAKKGDGKVFSADPLPLDALKSADADIGFKGARVILPGGAEVADLDVKATLADGRFRTELKSMKIGGGNLGGGVEFDGASAPASFDVDLVGKGIVLGDVLKQMDMKDALQGAATDLTVSLKGKGASVRELMAGLNGAIIVDTGEGKLNNKTIDTVGGDVFSNVFGALNPFSEKKKYSILKCAAVKVTIEDGMAKIDRGIAAETESTNVVGSGGIDLKKELLDIGMKPEASGGVGLSLGAAASMVRLTGPLAAPGVGLDALETAKTAASTAAAFMTFGLSKGAEALINTATRDNHPCATALGKAASAETEPKATAEPAKEEPKSGIGGAVEGVGKLFGFGSK